MTTIQTYDNGCLITRKALVVRESPLVLKVNDREIATLIASPHELRFLVAGFLRLQGFVDTVEDFSLLSVCEEIGVANVRIRKELPDRLQPVLTSGCGTGVTFALEGGAPDSAASVIATFTPFAIFRLAEELALRAESYRSHGGIHSSAVGDCNGNLVLFAEDIGRHNTLDRIAGEAMVRGADLTGMMLVTSGRISAEMAAKAARLGIALIASRTSATDMAVKICSEAGISLVGYVRGNSFTVYCHADRLSCPPATKENLTSAR